MKNKNSRQKKQAKKGGDDLADIAEKFDLTKMQVEDYKHAFDLFDKDGSGAISRDEIRQCIEQAFGNDESINIDTIIEAIDSNNDSEVDFEEFVKVMTFDPYKTEGAEITEEEMKKVYPLFINGKEENPATGKCKEADDEHDEHISEEEIRKIAEYLGDKDIKDEDIRDMVKLAKECAEGSDDKVNFDQFKAVINKRWDS